MRNKAQNLWPRCGFGCLSLIHLSPSYFQLDASKTRVQRRECDATKGLSQPQLVKALRLAIAVWCCTNTPPELQPQLLNVTGRRGVHWCGLGVISWVGMEGTAKSCAQGQHKAPMPYDG
jgi:hypothetical protein